MSNETNNIATEMQHPELPTNKGGKWDVTDWLQISIGTAKEVAGDASVYEMALAEILNLRESLKSAHAVATAFATKIQEVEAENKELHEMVDDLAAWNEGVEADNDTLRKEIARLKEEREANANNNLFRSTDMS
jgi:uncharacterized protein YlxW (UPF0749 family)